MNYAQIYFKKQRAQLERFTDLRILFGALIGVSAIIVVLFIIALSRTKIYDPEVTVSEIPQSFLQDKKKFVEVNLVINNFSEFEIIQNNFKMEATVWFLFEEDTIPESVIEQFQFENARILSKKVFHKRKLASGKTLISYAIELSFRGYFNYQYYPFDCHRISITLINPEADLNKIVYVSSDKNVMPSMPPWDLGVLSQARCD